VNNLRRQRRSAGQCHAIEEAAAIDERPVARAAHIFLLIDLIPDARCFAMMQISGLTAKAVSTGMYPNSPDELEPF
jgi:hypothetical protein